MKKLLSLALILMLLAPLALAEAPATDRMGNPIALPADPTRVICLSSAAAQIVEGLGMFDRLIAVDSYSPFYIPEAAELVQFDMMAPDIEQIAALEPDLVLVTSMSFVEGDNPYQPLIDMGVTIAVVPSSGVIADIMADILFVAQCFGAEDAGQAMVDEMQAKIDEIAAIGETISEEKSVFFEIGALPYLYSFGTGNFLDEMITLIGATNAMGDQEGWLSVTEESAIGANPDVILTSVNYIEDAVGEILARPGWENVTAVANGDVYYIDNAAASLGNQNIVNALVEMARAVYPDAYAQLED
ncbi:MAG: ABC transporter substrate-binding protein [Christensenellales bacterium]|jgi:iron complex transport system substrate-binding protein